MRYDLPTSLSINGTDFEIRTDFRDILTIFEVIADADLSESEKAETMLDIFYPGFEEMQVSDYSEALKQCIWFINGGSDKQNEQAGPKLMDWEQDFPLIVAPVNRVLGKEIRAEKYLHWWSLLAAYQEIGDCTFAQVVNIRNKKFKGKRLDKSEQEFYKQNRDLVNFKHNYTEKEENTISKWI